MSGNFSTISKINPEDTNTWVNKLFLSFDIDWAHDEILSDTLSLVMRFNVPVTWFVTHATPILNDIRSLTHQELGLHPNFNSLLDVDSINKCHNAEKIVKDLLDIVPEAKSIRSHSMTQSSRLLDLFQSCGLTHEGNHFIPHHVGIELKPWLLWNQLCKIPYFWEDDLHTLYDSFGISQTNPAELATAGGLKVFDFHPIHVFLNTESIERYERTRPLHYKPKELIKHRYEGYGTRNRLIELLELAKKV